MVGLLVPIGVLLAQVAGGLQRLAALGQTSAALRGGAARRGLAADLLGDAGGGAQGGAVAASLGRWGRWRKKGQSLRSLSRCRGSLNSLPVVSRRVP